MTTEQIREIIKLTVEELINKKVVKLDNYDHILEYVSNKLDDYFNNTDDANITKALKVLSDDYYIDIIYLQYRDEKTIEWIAEYFNKDTRTILRNKKRLIYRIYEEVK
jgi:hypothetical protein